MLSGLVRTLWGDLTREECHKFGLLSCIFFFIIGAYWMMRTMKNGIFMKIVGSTGIPYAKIISVIFMILLVMFYSKLVDLLEKHILVYVLTVGYGVTFCTIAYFLNHPTIGIANTVPSKSRIFGWLVYLVIESFGSLVVTLFWSFVASSMDTASAKRGYPIIIAGAQLGSVLGCSLDMWATKIGLANLLFFAAIGIFIVPLLVRFFISHYAPPVPIAVKDKESTGLIEGLRLLLTKPYLMGIFAVATFFEVIETIFDYQLKTLANQAYHSAAAVTEFDAIYGFMVNLLSFVFAFVGTSFFIRRFGLRFCLIAFPLTVAFSVCFMWSFYGLWVLAFGLVLVKGLSYTLNNPCKEIMYIPTSTDIKFKAKSWIDVFGSRSLKGVGGMINAFFPVIADLALYGTLISLGVVGVWISIARYVGNTNHKLVQEGKIIE